MAEESQDAYSADKYRSLGLIANPFVLRSERRSEAAHVSLEVHKEANTFLVALEKMSAEARPRPLWVERSIDINDFYNTAAENVAEGALIRDESLNYLPLYLQLFMARSGRVRSVLHVLAERVATRRFDLTLAEWVRRVMEEEPDTGLPAWEAVGDERWQAFIHEFESDPEGALATRFGENVLEREIVVKPPADVREASLEAEPDESDETAEEDELTAQMPDMSEAVVVGKSGEEEEAPQEMDSIVAYVLEYTKAHFSPVIARGLRAYVERGYGQLAQELKITKAPRKTLKKLTELAAMRFKKVVVIYDGFDGWMQVPEDLKGKLITGFTEIRMLLGSDGILVFSVAKGAAPELEDQFGGRDVVKWTFDGLLKVGDVPSGIDDELVDGWLEAATLHGQEPMSMQDEAFAKLAEEAEGDLARFIEMAGQAVDRAADRKARRVELVDASASRE